MTVPDGIRSETPLPAGRLRRVEEAVTGDLRRPWSLESIAGIACMHPSSFSRYFRRRVGMTLTEWIRAVRVARAIDFLEEDHLSIEAISGKGWAGERENAAAGLLPGVGSPTQHGANSQIVRQLRRRPRR